MDNIIRLYQQRLNLNNATFSRIDHDDTMDAIVYKVTLTTGKQLILKICSRSRHYFREMYFLNHFVDKLPVPRVVQSVPPEKGVRGAVLMECLQGTVLKKVDVTSDLAYELGTLLARIHANRLTGYGDFAQPQSLSPDPRIPFTIKLEENLAECNKHLPKVLIEQCRRYFDTHLDLLASVDGPCITHGDFRPGNVMVYDGKVQGIIDWATGSASFAEADFCSFEHAGWPIDFVNKSAFLSGYASIRPVPNYHAILPLLRLNKALGLIGFLVKRGTWQSKHAALYKLNRQFLETFL